MKRHVAVVAVVVSILGGCIEQSSTANEVGITPTDVGTTRDSSTGLKLCAASPVREVLLRPWAEWFVQYSERQPVVSIM